MTMVRDADSCDQEIFAEQRSNVLLVCGEHYSKRQSSFHRRVRESKELTQEQKLRLTKNHVQKIVKTYVNNITSMNPGVGFKPKNDSELQDQKAAQLHHAIWQDAVHRYDIGALIEDWCDDFVSIGEVAVKVFWDPSAGKIKAFEQAMGEDGEPLFEEDGSPMRGSPVYSGGFVFETIQGFNLLRDPNCKRMVESPYLISRKMVDRKELIAKFPEAEAKLSAGQDETYVVFDASKGGYYKAQNQVMFFEAYFRPCAEYPQGHFCFFTKDGEIVSGALPGGIFPIVWAGFDKIQTTPRARSPVKTMRPYQAEINRAASKMAEHQITLGDDKIILVNGNKLTQGTVLPGIRGINATGGEPVILAGRDGSQYLQYQLSQITELYQVMNVAEDSVEQDGQLDPYVLLFRSATQKKKFQRYIKRFERFLTNIAETYLQLAKIHLPDDEVIGAIGRSEQVNISEFKNSADMGYQIVVEAQSDDVETKLGRQLMLNHALQYVGNKLEREDIGKLMRAMPYSNAEESFNDLTIDYDSATNDILALDRGERPEAQAYDNHPYMVRRLASRKRQADFKYLPAHIQQAYDVLIQIHEQMEADNLAKLQAAEAGFIPTGGYLVTCDFYVADPKDPSKTRRVRLPYEAVQWLIKKLETQGQSLEQLESMQQGAQAQIAEMLINPTGQAPGTGSPNAWSMIPNGAATPGALNAPRNAQSAPGQLRI